MKKIFSVFISIVLLFSLSLTCFADSSYTNLVETATTEPISTEIYNMTGYSDGYRWSSSSKLVKSDFSGRVTGWMPYISGGTCRIKNFNLLGLGYSTHYVSNFYVVLYYPDGSITTLAYSILSGSHSCDYDEENDIATFILPENDCSFFRISAYNCSDFPIVTIDEEIIEDVTPTPTPTPDVGGDDDSGSTDDDNTGENTPDIEYVYIKENRPLFETPLTDYSVTEGLLLLIFVITMLNNIFKSHIKG